MTVIGTLANGKKVCYQEESGPSSYDATNKWLVRIAELAKIDAVQVTVKRTTRRNDLVDEVELNTTIPVAGNQLKFIVYQINTTTESPTAWAEVAGTTDISAIKIGITAIGS